MTWQLVVIAAVCGALGGGVVSLLVRALLTPWWKKGRPWWQ